MSAFSKQVGGGHYTKMKIQPFQYSMANGLDPMQHTIIKYVTRFRDKNGIEDLEKAKHTIDLLIEHESQQAAPQPAEPVAYHPCTSILVEGLKRLPGGSVILADWDKARSKVDATQAAEPVKVPSDAEQALRRKLEAGEARAHIITSSYDRAQAIAIYNGWDLWVYTPAWESYVRQLGEGVAVFTEDTSTLARHLPSDQYLVV